MRTLVLAHLARCRRNLIAAFLALLGVVAAELLAPWPLKIVFDQILLAKPWPDGLQWLAPIAAQGAVFSLLAMGASIVGIASFGGACGYLQSHLTARIGHQLVHQLRCDVFARIQQYSLSFHNRQHRGELLTRMGADIGQLRDLFTEWLILLVSHGLMLSGMLVVMVWINWRLTIVVVLTLPLMVLVAYRLNAKVRESVIEQRKQEGRMTARAGEVLGAITVVQAFANHQHEVGRFRQESDRNMDEGVRNARASAALTRSITFFGAVASASTLLFGAFQVIEGRLSPGELLIFMAYVRTLFKPLRDLGKLSVKFSRARVSARRIGELLEAEPESRDAPDAIEACRLRGEIVFDRVHFGYEPGKPVLEDASFRVNAGERVALVGGSGAGKTTLIGLLLRLCEPWSGTISIDGVDIRRYKRDSLRRELGVVLQDTVLFGISVRDNIAYGRPEATQAEIAHVAALAGADEFIAALPEGYDSEVGERGCSLSGGQRQRLCLARAMLKRPSILILDEPTSAVDAASARRIGDAVEHALAGRTVIAIAHRFEGLGRFDRVLRLQSGRVIESGADELTVGCQEARLRGVK